MTMQKAIRLYELGQWKDAEREATELVLRHPRSFAAHNLHGMILGRQGRFDEAVVALSRALDLNSASHDAFNNLGNALFRLNRNDEAEARYRRAIEIKPGFAEAENNLGNVLLRKGRYADAIERYRKAIEAKPTFNLARRGLVQAFRVAGELDQACQVLKGIIASDPGDAHSYAELADIALDRSQLHEAENYAREAIARSPALASPHRILAEIQLRTGRQKEAVLSLRKALELNPRDQASARHLTNLSDTPSSAGNYILEEPRASGGATLRSGSPAAVAFAEGLRLSAKDKHAEALEWFEKALTADPTFVAGHLNLGTVLAKLDRFADSIPHFQKVLELNPANPEAHHNLAVALTRLGLAEEAIDHYGQALAARPGYRACLINLALTQLEFGSTVAAGETIKQCLALYPDDANVHFSRSLVQLATGDLAGGFESYERRFGLKVFAQLARKLPGRAWNGESLHGKSIMLYTEQGLGDALQFLRYVPRVIDDAGQVVLEVPRPLFRVVPAGSWKCQMLVRGQELPQVDYHCSLMSLPHLYKTTLETVPDRTPYLYVPPAALAKWRQRLDTRQYNVGIVWAGQPRHKRDAERSVSLKTFEPLLRTEGVTWHSLQVGPRSGDLQCLPPGTVTDWSSGLSDFAETAALLTHLDLTISVDTSVVHLAGALGRPAWVMVSRRPDWRWLLDRADSPWYPTLKLYRQGRNVAWNEVVQRIAADLSDGIAERRHVESPRYLLEA